MKKIIIILICLIFTLSPLASATVVLESGTVIDPTDSNTTYTLGNTMSFSNVIIENDSVYFNDNIFQIESDGGATTVVISTLTLFVVTATDSVTFTLGGFRSTTTYDVRVDGTTQAVVDSNATGVLSFVYTLWSTHTFSIVLHGGATGGGGGNGDLPITPTPDINPDEEIILPLFLIIIAIGIFVIIVLWRRQED